MTRFFNSVIVSLNNIYVKIEVALFISNLSDVADTEEDERKEMMPKGYGDCHGILGHMVKNPMTVIVRWGAI